jgi:hypothetical protein
MKPEALVVDPGQGAPVVRAVAGHHRRLGGQPALRFRRPSGRHVLVTDARRQTPDARRRAASRSRGSGVRQVVICW